MRSVRAAVATMGTLVAALAWTIPAPLAVSVAALVGLASGLGALPLRVVSTLVAAGWAVLTAPFQSYLMAAALLALALIDLTLVLADLRTASLPIWVLALAVAAVEAIAVSWVFANIG